MVMISVVPRVEDVLTPTDVDDDGGGGGVLCCVLSLSLSRALILILLIDFIKGDGR